MVVTGLNLPLSNLPVSVLEMKGLHSSQQKNTENMG